MIRSCAKRLRIQIRERLHRGFTLLEVMMSLVMILVIVGGLATLYAVAMRANTIDKVNVQLLNSARAKIEQTQSIPYEQVGIDASGTASGPGYFVVDPINNPVYSTANGDILLSDTVTLKDGTVVTRTVTVTAVDDPADGTGANDQDGVTDPNTGTILDYKLVTVAASTTFHKVTFKQTLTTILQGSLDSEIDGATGTDADGATPPAPGAKAPPPAKTPPPPPTPPGGCDIPTAPVPKGPGRQGVSAQTGC